MTNGEMIQKVFNCEVCEPIMEDDIIHVIFSDKNDSAIGFDWSWWNMEYKEPTTKNDLGVDKEQLKTMIRGLTKWYVKRDNTEVGEPDTAVGLLYDDVMFGIDKLTPVTPQEPFKPMVEIDLDYVIKQKYIEREVLDKIRAEIKKWYWQADKQALVKDPCVVDAMIDLFIRTIDKYKAAQESEDKA